MQANTQTINVAILGLGTVGAGTLSLIQENISELRRRTGCDICITYVGTRRERPDLNLDGIKQSADLIDIVKQDDVDIVVEVIGGTTVAKDVMLTAIEHGKHVVTANKALLAEHGNEIFAAADAKGVHVAYEAAVAGGIPIIKVMREALAGNQIEWLAGIINGTGNFILTEMRDKGRDFADVLKEAQELGYAEADPTFDVEGVDAAHKLTLLASIAFGIPLQFDKVYCEGITKLTTLDVNYAEELGYRIKHLGLAVKRTQEDGSTGIELRVHPTLLPEEKLIANVNGVKNAVMVESDALGQTLYYGAGAGAGPTASAVMADVMDLVRLLSTESSVDSQTEAKLVPHLAFQPDSLADTPILTPEQMTTAYYLRVEAQDVPGVLADVTGILSRGGINIDAILQKPKHETDRVNVIITTQKVVESKMNAAIAEIEALKDVLGDVMRIRLESLD